MDQAVAIRREDGAVVPANAVPAVSSSAGAVTLLQFPLSERLRICEFLAQGTTLPAGMRGNPANVWIAAERGAKLGLSPTESISAVMVVNGIASVWGDFMKAIVMASGQLEQFEEWFEIDGERIRGDRFDPLQLTSEGKDVVAWCRVKRRGKPEVYRTFGVDDAKTAGLWMQKDTWRKSPKRMLAARPRSFALRDEFSDVLGGFVTREEAMDLVVESGERTEIADRSQVETKGAAIAETMGGGGPASDVPTETLQEMEMVESMLSAMDRVDVIESIRAELGIPKIGNDAGGGWITAQKAALYIRAMSLAVDRVTAEREAAASSGELPLGGAATKKAKK